MIRSAVAGSGILSCMPKYAIALLAVVVCLWACSDRPKISAKAMEDQLGVAIFKMNKALNGGYVNDARLYVAPEAEPDFEKLLQGFREKQYNLLLTTDQPQINYLKGEAKVKVNLMLGRYLEAPDAKQVKLQVHRWRYEGGAWRWHGILQQ